MRVDNQNGSAVAKLGRSDYTWHTQQGIAKCSYDDFTLSRYAVDRESRWTAVTRND